jgi:hypothetical protein
MRGVSGTRTGDLIVVRYADDTIVGFQHRPDADRFLNDLKSPKESPPRDNPVVDPLRSPSSPNMNGFVRPTAQRASERR